MPENDINCFSPGTTRTWPTSACPTSSRTGPGKRRNAIALAFDLHVAVLSFGELIYWANQLTHRLCVSGVGPEVLVAICAERSLSLDIALLAILRVGGAYVPLDVDYPADRLAFTLEDSGASLLLIRRHLSERLPEHSVATLCP